MVGVVGLLTASACSDDGGDGADRSSEAAAPPAEVTDVVGLNLLHGLGCPDGSDFCGAPRRLELLAAELEADGCPEVVGLGEVGPRQIDLLPSLLSGICDGSYRLHWDLEAEAEPFDVGAVLSRLPVTEEGYVELAGFPWSGYWVRVDTGSGALDVVTTHLASSVNNPPCTAADCPPACEAGLETGTCQSRELLGFLDLREAGADAQLIVGDLNQPVDHPRIRTLIDAGFLDAWDVAGGTPCDPATGEGCTCCVSDDPGDLDDGGLADPAATRDERIDFVLVRSTACDVVDARPFAATPADPDGGAVWVSDHSGVAATVSC